MELVTKDTCDLLTVSDTVFAHAFNEALVHQVVVAYASGARQGTRAQKNRAKVSGSGKKPWRQKGTGRARSGSIKSPIWRSGGVTFAAHTCKYKQKVNKKMYRSALKSIMSELIRQDRLIILKNFFIEVPKTKVLVYKLKLMNLEEVLIITSNIDKNLILAARNLHKVNVCNVFSIDPISLIVCKQLVMTIDTIKKVEEILK